MRFDLLLAGALASSLAASPVAAQGGDCEVVDAVSARRLAGPGGSVILFVSGPLEVHCGGGVIIRADSAHNTGTGELRLIRDVFYQDSTQILTSEFATYERGIARVTARGDVVVRDRFGPSVVRGTELVYDRPSDTRPEANIVVRGRPRAYLYEEGTPPLPEGMEPSPGMRVLGGDTIPAALQVDADRLELSGEDRILAHGRVQIIRENVRAFGDAADYDRAAGRMELTGNGRIEGEGYELFGDRITANLIEEELERVRSEGNAQLLGEDIQVQAPTIDIALAAGEVERMIAVSSRAGIQARAIAEDFTLTADSIQADAPGSVLERITAVGTALGERAPDSLSAGLPELIRNDWLRGDTIVGTFVQLEADSVAGDTAATALERLTSTGNARTLYRMDPANDDAGRQAVTYMTASHIEITFVDGEVAHVATTGPVDGLHLEPVRQAAAQREGDAGAIPAEEGAPEPEDGDAPDSTTSRSAEETR